MSALVNTMMDKVRETSSVVTVTIRGLKYSLVALEGIMPPDHPNLKRIRDCIIKSEGVLDRLTEIENEILSMQMTGE